MRSLKARLLLVTVTMMAWPVAAMAADPETQETVWEWVVRLLSWAAGGWHYY
jgi:hypothetical protein